MRSLKAILVLTVNFQFVCLTSLVKRSQEVSNIFEGLGYSPVCVASALASCERFAKPDCYLHVLYLMPELKSLLQGIKCENKPASLPEDTFRNIEILRKEGNSELSQFASGEILRNLTELFAAINDSAKEEIKNIRSDLNEIKTILSELKAEKSEFIDLKDSLDSQGNLMIKHNFESSQSTKKIDANNNAKNCAEVSKSCLAIVYPYEGINEDRPQPVVVPCVDSFDGRKWTVIQNRDNAFPRHNFYRPWSDYVTGFGDLNGEFWLGLDNIHALTNSTPMELRIDLEDYDGVKEWAKYDSFKIGNAVTKYVLTLGKYSGDAGDSFTPDNGAKFSTYDLDNDKLPANSALIHKGGWWYNSYHANLNGYQHIGEYSSSSANGIYWVQFRGFYYSLKKASMKVRPVN